MTIPGNGERAARLRRAIELKRAAPKPAQPPLPSRPPEQPAQLSEMQRGLWLQHQLHPDSAAYNLTRAFRVRGRLDLSLLERAWTQVVARHRLLHSTFHADGEAVRQRIHSPGPMQVERFEAAGDAALERAVLEARRPFRLDAGPLVRLLYIEDPGADAGLLALVLHHILVDERSLGYLWDELARAYEGRDFETAQPAQFDDFVHWSQARSDEARTEEIEHWRRRLTPPPEELTLPFARPAGDGLTAPGRLLTQTLGAQEIGAVRRLASAAGATPFAVFAFAFRLLLQRYAEGQDVAFGTPATTRSHPATARMIGYFLNPLPVRVEVDERRSVEQALREFGRELRMLLSHASVPLETLAQALDTPRRRGVHPIFQTMFVHQESDEACRLGDAALEPIPLDLCESKFDFTLFAAEGPASLQISIEYRTDRFDTAWMERLLEHYQTLLSGLTASPDRRIADISMMPPSEADRVESWARGPAPAETTPPLLPQRIRDRMRAAPDTPAVRCGDTVWSYGELERRAAGIAGALQSKGVGAGDRVGLYLDRSPEMLAAILGCHFAGAVYVPLDPRYPAGRNQDVLEDAAAGAVVTRSELADQLPVGSWATLDVEAVDAKADLPELASTEAESAAYILYTSGSTGRPKGVVVSHGNLAASTAARIQYYQAAPARFLLLPSVAFDSSVAGIFWALAEGGELVIPGDAQAADSKQLAELIAQARVDSLLCVPSLYSHILDAEPDRLRSLAISIVAGESLPPDLIRKHWRVAPHARLFNEYGPTEATVWASVEEMTAADQDRTVGIGRPIPGVAIHVLDSAGRPTPPGIPGQAWIAGPTVAQGYWHREDLTAERFADMPGERTPSMRAYRSGDRMSWSPDGRLLFLGRADEQIKLRGFRIEPGEIEAALTACDGVDEAAAVVHTTASGVEQLVAFYTSNGPAGDILAQLRQRLPEFMLPTRLVELTELPSLPNGKVDRRRLRQTELAPESSPTLSKRVLSDREHGLVSLWEGLLGRRGIALDANFFQLGGHSLLVVEMAAAIERDFGAVIPPAEIFAHPTIAELAQRIEHSGASSEPHYEHLFPVQPRGRRTPILFCVPHFFSETLAAHFRGQRPVYGLRGVSLRAEGNRGRWRTMRDLAHDLVEEIQRRFPEGPYILAGYSFGATMAVEAVRLLEERGAEVQGLYLIAPMPLDFYPLGPLRPQLDSLRRPIGELSPGAALRLFANGNALHTARPYQRMWRLLVTQPKRRLLCLGGRLRQWFGKPLTPRILHADVRLERFRLHSQYQPGPVRTPTVVFNAQEPPTDAAATWRPHFQGPFDVEPIPDPHLDEASMRSAEKLIFEYFDRSLPSSDG